MKDVAHDYLTKLKNQHRRQNKAYAVIFVIALLVAGSVAWKLHHVGISWSEQPCCGLQEHTHTDSCVEQELVCTLDTESTHQHTDACYEEQKTLVCTQAEGDSHQHTDACYEEQKTLVCTQAEGDSHQHTDACYEEQKTLVCTQAEGDSHQHTDACYETQKTLVCTQAEGDSHQHTDACYETQKTLVCTQAEGVAHVHTSDCYRPGRELACSEDHEHTDDCYVPVYHCGLQEHTHTETCYIDNTADVETAQDWEATLPQERTGVWAQDLVAIAQSQVGYGESQRNYVPDESGAPKGYTRYGAWYGNAYGDWDAMFAAFCLHYAGVPQEAMPYNGGADAWLVALKAAQLTYQPGAAVLPVPGELMFLDENGDGGADRVVIVESVDASAGTFAAIGGNMPGPEGQDVVAQAVYSLADPSILAYGALPVQTAAVMPLVETGERLDRDCAIVNAKWVGDSSTKSGYHIRTGTEPWDEDSTDPGNDAEDTNNIVRTFDTVSYTMEIGVDTRDGSTYYKEGYLYFEFILKHPKEQAYFDTQAMTWLASKESEYELYHTAEGWQVLRGKVLLTTNEGGAPVIGASTQELSAVVQVMAMANGSTLQPQFTFWMDYNEVPELTYDKETLEITGGLVTDSEYKCSKHEEPEYITIESPEITVTAAPRYNICLSGLISKDVGTFDFSTGNELACNKGAGLVTGRRAFTGIGIQMYGKTKAHGLKGCELPDEETDITFDLVLTSQYTPETTTTSQDVTEAYTPLVWSYEGSSQNNNGINADERSLPEKGWGSANPNLPYNSDDPYLTEPPQSTYRKCHNGGSWKMVQEGNVVHVTVSGYKVNPFEFPAGNISMRPNSDGDIDGTGFGTYNTATQKPWNAQHAYFSVGELWLVQPFYADSDTEDFVEDEYIVDALGSGTFTTQVQDGKLNIVSVSEQKVEMTEGGSSTDNSNQGKTNDDKSTQALHLSTPGALSSDIVYISYSGNNNVSGSAALTKDCGGNGRDWIYPGSPMGIRTATGQYHGDSEYEMVAADMLIKFDDAFFEPDGSKYYNDGNILFAAKPGKTGWDHQGKNPGEAGYDKEMRQAQIEDLIYFADLGALKAQGYVCVGALRQYRGRLGMNNNLNFHIGGHCKTTAQIGSVYMTTFDHRVWQKWQIQNLAAEYFDVSAEELTDDQYADYAKTVFPKISGNGVLPENYEAYGEPAYTNHYQNSEAMQNYVKTVYDESGVVTAENAGTKAADSCLVVGPLVSITKVVAQRDTAGDAKSAFSMDDMERVVDYALNVALTRPEGESTTGNAEYKTTVYVEDTLPSQLRYIPHSAYLGGTYTQGKPGTAGTITDGQKLDPEVITNKDGTVTLRWEILAEMTGDDTIKELPAIHFSCIIGKQGDEDKDVKNGDSVTNTARAYTDDDNRYSSLVNGNRTINSILISKLRAASIAKLADHVAVDVGEETGFTMLVSNNEVNPKFVAAVDILPYGTDGVPFTGPCVVTELTDQSDFLADSTIKFYYTTIATYRTQTGAAFVGINYAGSSDWIEMERSADGTITIPGFEGGFQPVAIAMVGDIPAGKTLKVHITTKQPEAKEGDRVVNHLLVGDHESHGDTVYVQRALSGLTWLDYNQDGEQDDNETMLSGVTVTLQKWNDDKSEYEDVYFTVDGEASVQQAKITTGYQLNLEDGTITNLEAGRYRFYGLDEGTYRVVFTSTEGKVALLDYFPSPSNAPDVNDQKDSDGIPKYDEDELLQQTAIEGIRLPPAEEIPTGFYESRYHDSGFYQENAIRICKIGDDNKALTGAEFVLSYRDNASATGSTMANFLETDNSYQFQWTAGADTVTTLPVDAEGLLSLTRLPSMPYRTWILTEVKGPDGFNKLEKPVEFKIVDGDIRLESGSSLDDLVTVEGTEMTVRNTSGYKLPDTGGAGTGIYTLGGILLIALPAAAAAGKTKRERKKGGNLPHNT